MENNHKLYVEISSDSLLGLVNALDALKNQPIKLNVIEEIVAKPPKPDIQKIDLELGSKGKTVLHLLAVGNTYEEIAKKTEITINGVRYYVKKVFKVLDANNARMAVNNYLEMGGTI